MPRVRLSKINPALLSANVREGEDMTHVTLTAEEADLLYEAAASYSRNLCNDADEWRLLNRALTKFRRASTITIEEEE